MQTIWFVLVAFMLVAYVVLDGFDLGAGAVHLIAARTEEHRGMILNSIGPVWDGNEVWLIAAGGTMFLAFPLLYASSFSGFYLPLTMVLWLLVFRAIGIEFRERLAHPVWCAFFDAAFSLASILLILLFGAAFGNVIRGVPLGLDHSFFLPLWTNFLTGPQPGAIDWYTMLCGVVAVIAVSLHGALYLVMKTEGALNARLRIIAGWLWPMVFVLTGVSLFASVYVRPALLDHYRAAPAGWLIPVLVLAALSGMLYFSRTRRERDAFLSSCLFLIAILGGAAFAIYPAVLPSSSDPALSLTIQNTAAGAASLANGLIWWSIGIAIAIGYSVIVYSTVKGKVNPAAVHFAGRDTM